MYQEEIIPSMDNKKIKEKMKKNVQYIQKRKKKRKPGLKEKGPRLSTLNPK